MYAHFPRPADGITTSRIIYEGYTEITHEEFSKFILNKERMKTYRFTREMAGKIFEIACSDWKDIIIKKVKEVIPPFSNEGVIPESFVKEMFDASSVGQRKALGELFTEYKKDGNAFIKRSTSIVGLLENINRELFGSESVIQILSDACPINRSDSMSPAFFVSDEYEVFARKTLHGTYIEIRRR